MDTVADGALYTRTEPVGDIAYREIKSWILRGAIPVGVRLREERIAERLAVSRTPVREAMLRLYGERFLERNVLVPDAPDTDPDFVLVDEDFHRRLAVAGGNRMLADELRRIAERIRPVRSHDFVVPGRIEATVAQHLAILDAALSGGISAPQLLEQHILESQAVVEAALGRAMERMLTAGEDALAW